MACFAQHFVPFLFYLSWILFNCALAQGGDCFTQDGKQGICVAQQYCRMGSASTTCYFQDGQEHVCCPLPEDFVQAPPKQRPTTRNYPTMASIKRTTLTTLFPTMSYEITSRTTTYRPKTTRAPLKLGKYSPKLSTSQITPILCSITKFWNYLFSECGEPLFTKLIAGGVQSKPGDWPWMSAIFRRAQKSQTFDFVCGGVLITPKFILSAAHCFTCGHGVCSHNLFLIRLGTHEKDVPAIDFSVSALVIHEDYDEAKGDNDIALLRLTGSVSYSRFVSHVCLPPASLSKDDLAGRNATVIGWGHTSAWSGSSKYLNEVVLPVISMRNCSDSYRKGGNTFFDHDHLDSMLCAGNKDAGKDSCKGDSGGPLVLKNSNSRWTVVGIVSFGPTTCGTTGFPGVYTRVAYYMNWIKQNLITN